MTIGKILHNRYKITEYIGCGGMADVYKAFDTLLEREVAVKILRPQFASDENFIRKFHREAQSAASLSDSHIVSIFDVGHEDDIYFIVMEYVSGETLQKLIERKAPIDPSRAVSIAKDIAYALAKAHAKGIVHCDIKPHNILLTEKGDAKVSDFGIARAVSSSAVTADEAILGSVHYLSPEQAQGGQVSHSSDLYSLGVVLFEMLTGKVPFSGDTPMGIAMQHVQTDPPAVREINENIPPILESILLKALAKKPEDRYKDASEFIKDLNLVQSFIAGEDITAATMLLERVVVEDDNLLDRRIRKFKSNKLALILAVLVLLFGGFYFGMVFVFSQVWNTEEVKVPNVVGKQTDEAIHLLEGKFLEATQVEEFSTSVPKGFVISQDPESGSIVKEQRLITLFVSKGPEMVTVPTLINTNVKDVRVVLTKARLILGKVEEKDEKDKPEGTILAQSPSPNDQVAMNTHIDLVIVGPKEKKVIVPDVTGKNLEQAKKEIESAKLKFGGSKEQATDKAKKGTVIDQSPSANEKIVEGSSVTLVVAKEPEEKSKQVSVEFIVPSGDKGQKVQLIVTDSKNRRVVYEGTHNPGDKVSKSISGVGSIRVQFYSNENLVGEKNL